MLRLNTRDVCSEVGTCDHAHPIANLTVLAERRDGHTVAVHSQSKDHVTSLPCRPDIPAPLPVFGNEMFSIVVVPIMEKMITMYGADWCGDCRRSKKLLDEMGVDYDYIDLIATPEAAERAQAISGRTNIPVVAFADGTHLVEPSNTELREKVEAQNATA